MKIIIKHSKWFYENLCKWEKILLLWIEINKPQNNRPLVASRSVCIWCGKWNCRNNEDEDCYHLIIIHNFFERDLYAAIVHNCENLKRSFFCWFSRMSEDSQQDMHDILFSSNKHNTQQHREHNKTSIKLVSHSMRIIKQSDDVVSHIYRVMHGHKNWLAAIDSLDDDIKSGRMDRRCEGERDNQSSCILDMWKRRLIVAIQSFITEFIIELHLKCLSNENWEKRWIELFLVRSEINPMVPDKVNLSNEKLLTASLWPCGWAIGTNWTEEILCRITAFSVEHQMTGNNFCEKSVECVRGGLKTSSSLTTLYAAAAVSSLPFPPHPRSYLTLN